MKIFEPKFPSLNAFYHLPNIGDTANLAAISRITAYRAGHQKQFPPQINFKEILVVHGLAEAASAGA